MARKTKKVATRRKKVQSPVSANAPASMRVMYQDIRALRTLLRVSNKELDWLLATPHAAVGPGRAAQHLPISNPKLAILVRCYSTYPEIELLPVAKSFAELYKLAKPGLEKYLGEPMSIRRFGILFGGSQFSSHRWSYHGKPSDTVLRLFLLLERYIERYGGDEGAARFMRLVEEEAHARGFNGGIREVFKTAGWRRFPKPGSQKKTKKQR